MSDKEKRENMVVNDVLCWIMENRERTNDIDAINRASFPFSSRYRSYSGGNEETEEEEGYEESDDTDETEYAKYLFPPETKKK